MERLLLGRALGVDDGLERLVLDDDRLGGASRLLGVLGRDDGDRLAVVADAIDREHRLVGELEAVRLAGRERRRGSGPRGRRASSPPAEMSISRMRACACGLRSVWPQSIPAALRSLE